MGDAYSENESLCREQDAAARKRAKKTRHRITGRNPAGQAKWVKLGGAISVPDGADGVEVLAITDSRIRLRPVRFDKITA